PYFFADFAKTNPGKWPVAGEKTENGETVKEAAGKPVKEIRLLHIGEKKDEKGEVVKDTAGNPVREVQDEQGQPADGDDLRATCFDLWLRDAKPDLEKVPADYVTASGSGLDPHISQRNARFQARRVIEERARLYREARSKAGQPVPSVERTETAVRREV